VESFVGVNSSVYWFICAASQERAEYSDVDLFSEHYLCQSSVEKLFVTVIACLVWGWSQTHGKRASSAGKPEELGEVRQMPASTFALDFERAFAGIAA